MVRKWIEAQDRNCPEPARCNELGNIWFSSFLIAGLIRLKSWGSTSVYASIFFLQTRCNIQMSEDNTEVILGGDSPSTSAQSDTENPELEERVSELEDKLEQLLQEFKPTIKAVETQNGVKLLVENSSTRWYNLETVQDKIEEVAE